MAYKYLDHPDRSLELTSQALRKMVDKSMGRIQEFVDTLPLQPVCDFDEGLELARGLKEALPRTRTSFDDLLKIIFDQCAPKGINIPSPGYLAYIPVGGLLHSSVAELITNVLNRWPGIFDYAPGFVQLESNVIQWLCEVMGMPSASGGILTSGGSLANFTAVYTARATRLPENFLQGTLYCSDEAHFSIQKAAVLAGFPRRNVRQVPTGPDFRMQIPLLKNQIETDRKAGFQPFMLIGNAGSTATGAIDDLAELKKLADREKLWFHVDAAWAGGYRLTDKGASLMKGVEEADSITIDPHKAFFTPFGSGALLVRDQELLLRTHSNQTEFLPMANIDLEKANFANMSPELSRTMRGLQLWLPLKMHGIDPFKKNFEEKLELAEYAAQEIAKIPGMKIITAPQASIVVFRYEGGSATDAVNQKILDHVNAPRTVMLSGAKLKEKFCLRLCPVAHNTHREQVDTALGLLRQAVSQL